MQQARRTESSLQGSSAVCVLTAKMRAVDLDMQQPGSEYLRAREINVFTVVVD